MLLACGLAPAGQGAPRAPDLAQAGRAVAERANAFRRAQGQPPVKPNPTLDAAAAEFAAYMARTGRYSHEADGREPAERAQAHGYAWCLVSENIAYAMSSAGFETAELAGRLVQGWIDSPGHRRNLLDPGATETGVAIAGAPGGQRFYAVQMFGRPASLRIRFELANRSDQAVRYELGGQRHELAPGVTRWHERCDAPRLLVSLPGQREARAIQPGNGARYRIEPGPRGPRLAGG